MKDLESESTKRRWTCPNADFKSIHFDLGVSILTKELYKLGIAIRVSIIELLPKLGDMLFYGCIVKPIRASDITKNNRIVVVPVA